MFIETVVHEGADHRLGSDFLERYCSGHLKNFIQDFQLTMIAILCCISDTSVSITTVYL